MTKILDWENLKELRCPKCYEDLEKRSGIYACMCGFTITIIRLKELSDEMIDSQYEREQFEELLRADQ